MSEKVILKPGREKSILRSHRWIFSGAVQTLPQFENGSILDVHSATGEFLAQAYFNRSSSILGRVISFDRQPVEDVLRNEISRAVLLRKNLFDKNTTGYRLINSEGDSLPGLVADNYDGVLVLQIGTLGMEKLKSSVLSILSDQLSPTSVLEKSALPARREEGLKDFDGILSGEKVSRTEILENGLRFEVDFEHAQKTGFFLDQRENRSLIRSFAKDRAVLNCFSYTGGFSVYALDGGARSAVSLDSSSQALETAKSNYRLNRNLADPEFFVDSDANEYLRKAKGQYDMIVLDPPAFAKKKADVNNACRAYKDLNRVAMLALKTPGFILTCSCSHFIDENLFGQVIFQAAMEAGRKVRILQTHRLAMDHPVSVFHPEGAYLKSLFLYVES